MRRIDLDTFDTGLFKSVCTLAGASILLPKVSAPNNRANASPPNAAHDQFEKQVRQHLAESAFRKARDLCKTLVKVDKARFFPLLLESNVGLIRHMISKGQVSEAKQVIAYLKTIAPAEQVAAIEIEMTAALHSKDASSASTLPQIVALLTTRKASLDSATIQRLVDRAVLSFESIPGGDPAASQLRQEVQCIHDGLTALSEGRLEGALEVVRPLAQTSTLGHWKIFIKGLVAFYAGDREKAARFLCGIPSGSAPANASKAYLLLLNPEPPAASVSPLVLERVFQVAGFDSSASTLRSADWLWRNDNNPFESYALLSKGWPPFPAENLELAGLLSEFYFKSAFCLPMEQRDEYISGFETLVYRNLHKNSVERRMALQMICLAHESHPSPNVAAVKRDWEEFIRLLGEAGGCDPRLQSMAYLWLGKRLSAERPGHGPVSDTVLLDGPGARAALEKGTDLDPANLDAHLRLCRVLEQLNLKSVRNRLLDKMTIRFPDNKDVLVQAGRACLERKAFKKAWEYLERAREANRLDPLLPELLVTAADGLATEQFKAGRADKGRQTLARIEPFIDNQSSALLRNQWTFLARTWFLEKLHGNAGSSEEILDRALAASPSPAVFHFYCHFIWFGFSLAHAKQSPHLPAFARASKNSENAKDAIWLLRIACHFEDSIEESGLMRELDQLGQYLSRAAKNKFTREEARQIVELSEFLCEFESEAKKFIKSMLKADPKDPFFRLSHLSLSMVDPAGEKTQAELDEIIQEAGRRGDEATLQKAKKMRAQSMVPDPFGPGWGPEDEDDEDEAGIGNPFDEMPMPILPPGAARTLEKILDALDAGATKADLRKLKQQLSNEVPGPIFDLMASLGSEGLARLLDSVDESSVTGSASLPKFPSPISLPPKPPRPAPPKPRPKLPLPDPDQLDLF